MSKTVNKVYKKYNLNKIFRREINNMKMTEYINLNKIPKYNEYKEWYTLTDEEFEMLEKAVIKYLPTKLKQVKRDGGRYSYHLKHVFEDLLGFYVSNYDMKLVMDKLEYTSTKNDMNPHYNISKKELKELEQLVREIRYGTKISTFSTIKK